MNRKIIAVIVLGLMLLASLLACGYFGLKTIRRTRLRRAAMEAYEKKEYALAERLLHAYVTQDPNAEEEFVTLAKIYHEFGNAEMEAQMWQTANALNPLNPEYREKMLTSAVRSASYALLHSILGRKAKVGESFTDQELYLYVISSYRSGYTKDGDDAYRKAVKDDPEAFHKSELGRLAEFMADNALSEKEREDYLKNAIQSEDPVIRFEAIYNTILRVKQSINSETAKETELEALLKQAVETNYFVGTQLLADFFFSRFRFSDVIDLLAPYLKTIDNLNLYLLYAESCAFEGKLDELKDLEKKLRRRPGSLPILADYCEILIAYLEDDEKTLAAAVRKSGKVVNSPLARFIRLRVAIANGTYNEIQTIAREIFSTPQFHDLHDRALFVCLNYISGEIIKPEDQNNLSQLADLATILSDYLHGNQMLVEIMLMDQYKKGLMKEADLLAALKEFPDDEVIQQIAAEYMLLNGKADEAMSIIEPLLAAEEEETTDSAPKIRFLYMLALDQLERRDEASAVFQKLVEQSEFDLELLNRYFLFCVKNKREADLTGMADKLDSVNDGNLEHYGNFFRAAALLATEDGSGEKEALDLLASTPTDDPEFTLYAANRLSDYGRLDEAEAKYKAILKTYRTPPLIYINLSELFHERGDETKALEAAKEAFELEKTNVSMLPAFIYAQRLSEAKRYEEAVNVLNFPNHAENYREDVIALWVDCMHHVIENSIAGERYMQAEDQCKHLLVFSPDDEFGKENLEKVRKLIKQQNNNGHTEQTAPAA